MSLATAYNTSRVWLVTGSSSGFGRYMTELALSKGDNVIATLRKPEVLSELSAKYSSDKFPVLKVDVTKSADVRAAFSRGVEAFGRIDIVFNNAGHNVFGELESMDEGSARSIFEVNFWGATNATKEALRVFREENKPSGGRLLQVSSRGGLVGFPAGGIYSASKFALEGLTESVVQELNPDWNIKVTIVEPGPFRTEIFSTNGAVPQHPAYADPSLPGSKTLQRVREGNIDGDARKAVEVIERLTHLESPPLRLPLHRNTIASLRQKVRDLSKVADEWESWSEDVYLT